MSSFSLLLLTINNIFPHFHLLKAMVESSWRIGFVGIIITTTTITTATNTTSTSTTFTPFADGT